MTTPVTAAIAAATAAVTATATVASTTTTQTPQTTTTTTITSPLVRNGGGGGGSGSSATGMSSNTGSSSSISRTTNTMVGLSSSNGNGNGNGVTSSSYFLCRLIKTCLLVTIFVFTTLLIGEYYHISETANEFFINRNYNTSIERFRHFFVRSSIDVNDFDQTTKNSTISSSSTSTSTSTTTKRISDNEKEQRPEIDDTEDVDDDDDDNNNPSSSSSSVQHPPPKQSQQSQDRPPTLNLNNLIVDVLSIGSITRPQYQDAQEMTFGSHNTIRHFYKTNEYNDTESDCSTILTTEQALGIAEFCRSPKKKYKLMDTMLRTWFLEVRQLKDKTNPAGWICAQKRPIDGISNVLQKYRSGIPLPDYLLVVDDDSYFNLHHVLPYLMDNHPSYEPHAVAGCLLRNTKVTFTCSYGGWGTMVSKATLENLLRPIDCSSSNNKDDDNDDDPFISFACKRLQENLVGESALFTDGMSISDLMYRYTFDQSFIDFPHWNDVGYCMHSDVTVGYFFNYYNIPKHTIDPLFLNITEDRLSAYRGSTQYGKPNEPKYKAMLGECSNDNVEKCNIKSHACHYQTDHSMIALHKQVLDVVPTQFQQQQQYYNNNNN